MKRERSETTDGKTAERTASSRQRFNSVWIAIWLLVLASGAMAAVFFSQGGYRRTIAFDEKELVSPVFATKLPLSGDGMPEVNGSQLSATQKGTGSESIPCESFNVWPPDWSKFLPSLLATFIGALLGFLFAIGLDRWRQERARTEEEKQRRQKHISVLQVLADEVNRNRDRLDRLRSDLRTTSVIDYSVILDVWSASSREVLEAIRDVQVAQAVAKLYDCLSQVASALVVYNHLALAGGDSLLAARIERLPRLENLVAEATNVATVTVQGVNAEIAALRLKVIRNL